MKKGQELKMGNQIYFKIAGKKTKLMHFFVDSLLLVTQIIKGKQLYYKM
jgi:hypothetical protein